jgi:hypothetical protein
MFLKYRRRKEYAKQLVPKIMAIIKAQVHENSWCDAPDILAQCAEFMNHFDIYLNMTYHVELLVNLQIFAFSRYSFHIKFR